MESPKIGFIDSESRKVVARDWGWGKREMMGKGDRVNHGGWVSSVNRMYTMVTPVNNTALWDSPGGPLVKNLPCNARDAGSIPGQGTKISHAMEQLNLRATTREPVHHNKRSRVTQQRSHVLQLRPDAVR